MAPPKGKKKIRKNVAQAVVHIFTTFNNSIVTVADAQGDVISWSSSGTKGFKGSKKSTPFAAQVATEEACRKAKDHGVKSVEVYIKGPGAGRESALRAVASQFNRISLIKDVTPIPHNGCRPPKRRRV
jgi:small subunit ribosomal protein S11